VIEAFVLTIFRYTSEKECPETCHPNDREKSAEDLPWGPHSWLHAERQCDEREVSEATAEIVVLFRGEGEAMEEENGKLNPS